MRSLPDVTLALGAALVLVGTAGAVATGCGTSNSGTLSDSDASNDGTVDAPADSPLDAGGPDSTASDAPPDTVDSASDGDGSSAIDSPSDGDASPADSSPDASDSSSDASDASSDALSEASDAPTGADGAAVLAFAIAEANGYCNAMLGCCPGGRSGYDVPRCVNINKSIGWETSLPNNPVVYTRSNLAFDQTRATNCLAALQTLPCGSQTAAQWGAITAACELVIQGIVPSNTGGCVSSFECAPGNYCDPTVDGGLCAPLATQGHPCNTKISVYNGFPFADEMCSYLGSGQPALFCDLFADGGVDASTCQPVLANGASCSTTSGPYYYDDMACAAPALCDDNSKCGGTTSYPYAGFCNYYKIVDAGGGG